MLPTIALVGRPNVGKSTLFNRLTKTRNALVADFHELGLGASLAVSAAHGENVRGLIDEALARAPAAAKDVSPSQGVGKRIKVAIVGRPNVGKSTLANALLGEERMVTFDEPG